MALIEDLVESAGHADVPVRDIILGPAWTMVASAGSGVASSPPAEQKRAPDTMASLHQKPLGDLLAYASSPDPLKASVGIAALNSALAGGPDTVKPRSFSIPRARGKSVAVIGDFDFIEDLGRIAGKVITLKGAPEDAGSPSNPDRILAGADIAIIRGSTLIDGTLESWLSLTRHCYTVVYGPSTPLSSVLFEYGADQLVGIRVVVDDIAAEWIRAGRDNLPACPGIRPIVLARATHKPRREVP